MIRRRTHPPHEDAMTDALSQDQQQGSLTTPLGPNVLALASFSVVEGLSELFEIRIEAVSIEANLNFASTLGLSSTILLKTQDDQQRYFDGVMTEARWAGTQEDLYVYQLVLRPWLWLLTRSSDCQIFAQMTPIDIIKQVFSQPRLLRFPRRDDRLAADPRILRPVSRDRLQFRLPADGAIRRLLFLRAFGG